MPLLPYSGIPLRVDFQIAISGKGDLSAQIYRALRSAILGGRLRPDQPLPSSRELAVQLRVARKTVLRAYERLRSESLIEARVGSGTHVSSRLLFPRQAPPQKGSLLSPRSEWLPFRRSHARAGRPVRFAFNVGVPDVASFPFAIWRSLLASSGRVLGTAQGPYADPQGDPRLREAIAQYVAFTRAVVCHPDQIVVTRGAQQAVDLLARVLLRPGDIAAVEEPGYSPFRELLSVNGIELAAISVDSEGMIVADLPPKARLVCVTPSHQFPLGTPMPLHRKLSLLRWAAKHRACIIEDDYDSEYRFDPRPLESLQSLDRHGLVAYVGTFSKLMYPGLRMGFVVAPPTLVPALAQARYLNDSHESLLIQHALTRFITEGHLARHVRRMARAYGRRRATLLEWVNRKRGVFGQVIPSVAGLHVTCLQTSTTQSRELLQRARRASVHFTPLSAFSTRPGPPGIVLGYGAISEENIVEALKAVGP